MREFHNRKKTFLDRLEREASQGRVDGDILPLLRLLNSHPSLYTTSSCSGRIMLAEVPWPSYSKGRGFRPVAKWHHPVSPRQVASAAAGLRHAWLMVRGAILHVAAADLKTARQLVQIARETGHKHSGIIAMGRGGVIVEMLGEERLDIPLKHPWGETSIEAAVDAANKTLALAKVRLYWLAARLEAQLFGIEAPTPQELGRAVREAARCISTTEDF